MPNIRTYDAGVIGYSPTETGVEARAGTARRVGMFFNQAAGAAQEVGRQEEQLGAETQRTLAAAGRTAGSAIAAAGDTALRYFEHQ